MSFIDSIRELFRAEEEFDEDEADDFEEPAQRYTAPQRKYGLPVGTEPLPRREPLAHERERERENIIPLRGSDAVKKITERLKIVLIEPTSVDECARLVDSLKGRKPIIIKLGHIENDMARKIFYFLSGATYALNGNVQKIDQNIFVFLPENFDVQENTETQGFRYGDEKPGPWR